MEKSSFPKRDNKEIPNIINGMPIMAPMMVEVNTKPNRVRSIPTTSIKPIILYFIEEKAFSGFNLVLCERGFPV